MKKLLVVASLLTMLISVLFVFETKTVSTKSTPCSTKKFYGFSLATLQIGAAVGRRPVASATGGETFRRRIKKTI